MSGGVANVRAADLVLRDVAVGLRIKVAHFRVRVRVREGLGLGLGPGREPPQQ